MRKVILLILMTVIPLSCNSKTAENTIIIGSIREGLLFDASEIYAVDENGTNLPISPPFSEAIIANWSPNSQWVVYETVDVPPHIIMIRSDGREKAELTNNTYTRGHEPAWSPSGNHVAAYFEANNDQYGLYVVDVSCILKGQECAINYQFIVKGGGMPTWSPDGKQLAFWMDRQIFVVSIDAPREVIQITPDDVICFDPEWSPTSDDIAMRCSAPGRGINIFLATSDGSNFRNISNSESLDLLPTWSPDGTKIAFASERAEDLGKSILNEGIYSNAVYIMDSDGTNVKRVSPYGNESIDWIDWVGQ